MYLRHHPVSGLETFLTLCLAAVWCSSAGMTLIYLTNLQLLDGESVSSLLLPYAMLQRIALFRFNVIYVSVSVGQIPRSRIAGPKGKVNM